MTTGRKAILALAVALAAPLPYLPCLGGGFVSDDVRFVAANEENLAHALAPWRYVVEPGTNATPPDPDIYRPLRTWSFAIDRALAGLDPRVLHAHSLVLHGAVSGLLVLLLLAVAPPAPAAVAALLFAWHPLASEAVCWISSRADLQCALFALLALLLARRAESAGRTRRRLGAAAGAAALLAGLAKETGAVVAALHPIDRWARGRRPFGALGATAWLAAGGAAYLALYLAFSSRAFEAQVAFYEGSPRVHLGYAIVGWGRLLRLVFWPSDLLPLWEPALFSPLGTAAVAGSAAALAALALAAAWLRRRVPAAAAGIVFFAVALLPAGNVFFPMRTVLAERFAYLPLAGLALAAAGLLATPWALRRRLWLAALLLLAPLGWRTASRAADWGDPERLYRSAVAADARSYFGHLGLAGCLLARGERTGDRQPLVEARDHFRAALRAAGRDRPKAERAAVGLARAAVALGAPRDLEEAVSVLRPIIEGALADPDHARACGECAEAPYLASYCLVRLARASEAERLLERWRSVFGPTARLLDGLAELRRLRHDGRCITLWREAIALDPDYAPARLHLARLLAEIPSMRAEARRQLRELLARHPNDAEARALLSQLEQE